MARHSKYRWMSFFISCWQMFTLQKPRKRF